MACSKVDGGGEQQPASQRGRKCRKNRACPSVVHARTDSGIAEPSQEEQKATPALPSHVAFEIFTEKEKENQIQSKYSPIE
jgi:hypothetical protein